MTTRKSSPQQNQIIILCLNPKCTSPSQRCLDSRTIRTHPSDCSRHYFSVDTILSTHWSSIPDYPSDPLGLSISKKLKSITNDQKNSYPFFRRYIQDFKSKMQKAIQQFSKKFQQYMPSSSLQDYYYSTYSLQTIQKNLQQKSNPEFITKCINQSYSKTKYGQLESINQKLQDIQQAFNNILSGVKTQMKSLLDSMLVMEKQRGSQFRFEDGKIKPKIEYGLIKSKFVASCKIQCINGQIMFPKLDNIVSFLPWLYTDRGFNVGVHQLKITSLKFPSISNAGFTVLSEHDIDTYPYHNFKSLFSKQGKGFKLVSSLSEYDQFQSTTMLKAQQQNKQKSSKKIYTQLQYTISQIAQVVLRLELNTNPRAIIRNVQGTSVYVCPLQSGKKYRMGVYGSGWTININQLY